MRASLSHKAAVQGSWWPGLWVAELIYTNIQFSRRAAAGDAASASSAQDVVNVCSADGAKSTATSAIDTGDVHTDGGAAPPPADMATSNTNNPVGLDGTTPMGPNDDGALIVV